MADRPSFQEIYMRLAKDLSRRSSCHRRSVGAILTSVDYRKVLAVGYNGNASGLPNKCDRDESGNCGCLHAEENMVINCDCPREQKKVVFVTTMPCAACAKRIINLGNVTQVYYCDAYHNTTGKELLELVGIPIEQFTID